MTDETRVLHSASPVRREDAECRRTGVAPSNIHPPPLAFFFERHAEMMARKVLEEQRPGIMVFALGADRIEGTMWLRATAEYRAGSIGRHGRADLFLDSWHTVSLRHALVLVRKTTTGLRIHLLDLSSCNGLMLEDGTFVRAADLDGFTLLWMAGHAIAVVPTGAPLPWDPANPGSFRAAAPRKVALAPPELVVAHLGGPRSDKLPPGRIAGEGPIELGTAPLCLPYESPAGRLTLSRGGDRETFLVSGSALDRGIVLGRYERCQGHKLLSDERVSRVHAAVVRRDGVVMTVDVGSTNGTSMGEEEFRCADVTTGARFELARCVTVTWMPLD